MIIKKIYISCLLFCFLLPVSILGQGSGNNEAIDACCDCFTVEFFDGNGIPLPKKDGDYDVENTSKGEGKIWVKVTKTSIADTQGGDACDDATYTFFFAEYGKSEESVNTIDNEDDPPTTKTLYSTSVTKTFPITLDPKIKKYVFIGKCKNENVEYDNSCDREYLKFGSGCKSCSDSTCATVELKSAMVTVPLGVSFEGDVKAELVYHSEVIENPGVSILALKAADGLTVVKDSNGYLKSMTTDTVNAVISAVASALDPVTNQPIDPNAFKVEFSHATGTGEGDVYRTMTIQNIIREGVTILEVRMEVDGNTLVTEYTKPGANQWVMVKASGLLRENKTVTTPDEATRIERIKSEELLANETYQVTSDREETYTIYSWGDELTKLVIDPDNEKLTTTWSYYEMGDVTGANGSHVGYSRLASMTRYDGYVETHSYEANKHTRLSPFAGDSQGMKTSVEWNTTANTTITTKIVADEVVSKVVVTEGTDTTSQKSYTDATAYLETVTEYYPLGQDFGRQLKKVTRPGGAVTIYEYSRLGGNKTTTIYRGLEGGSNIIEGTKTERVVNVSGELVSELVVSISATPAQDGLTLDSKLIIAHDDFGRVLTTQHFPNGAAYTTSREFSCCGVVNQTDRSGVTTYYAYDPMQRMVKTNRLGVTTETERKGLTVSTYRYPETSATAVLPGTSGKSLGNEISRSVRNLSGKHTESWGRTASDGSFIKASWTDTSYNPGNGLSQTSVTSVPMTGSETADPTQTTEAYLDGRTYQSYGDLSPHTRMSYTVGTSGVETTRSIMEGTIARESVTSITDRAGRITSTVFADNATSTVTYNSIGQVIESTDPDGVINLFAYNAEGQRTTTALDLNANGTIDYDTDQVTFSETNPTAAHGTTVMRTISKVWKPSDSGVNGGTVVSYSDRAVDGLSSWSTQFPNGANLVSSSETTLLGSGNATSKSISPAGAYTIQTTTSGLTAKSESFDSADNPISSVMYQTHDSMNRPTHIKDSRHTTAAITAYVNDVTDAVDSVTDAAGNATSFTYDLRNRRTTIDAPDTPGLDASGNATLLANITTTSYFPNGQTKETAGAQTYKRSYTYDYANRMSTLTTYGGTTATTGWVYDNQRGWLTEKNHAGESVNGPGNTADYTYTAAGRLATRTWERGVVTLYHYDSAGRQDKVTYTDDTPQVAYIHDRLSRPTFVIQGSQIMGSTVNVNEYQYDINTLALSKEIVTEGAYDSNATTTQYTSTQAFTRTLDRTRDSEQRPVALTVSVNGTTEHESACSYDAAGRLATVAATSLSPSPTFTYGYQPNTYGLIKTVTGPAHTVTNTYEANRNVLTTKENKVTVPATPAVASNFVYTVNAIGQRITLATTGKGFDGTSLDDDAATGPAYNWSYNARGELVEANDTSTANNDRAYQFDGIGNREKSAYGLIGALPATANYTANALNQYTSVPSSPSALSHDTDGNLTAGHLHTITTGGTTATAYNATLTWDAENRLIEVEDSATTIATYQYDHLSRRISKTAGSTTTRYIYDGWNIVTEYTGATLNKTYTWGMDLSGSMQGAGGVGGLLSVRIGSSEYYPTYDGNGNVSEYLDSNGAVQAHYEYDAFGNTIVSNGTKVNDFSHRFSTKPLDAETGLYYYGYRYYDPQTGRWPSRDPIKERGGFNLYGFIGNDGVNKLDYLGLWTELKRKKGHRWATTCAEEGDEWSGIPGRMPKMSEVKKWVKNYDGPKPTPGKTYLVPNTIPLYTTKAGLLWKDGPLAAIQQVKLNAAMIATTYEMYGFKIIRHTETNDADLFMGLFEEDGIYGIIFAGHGADNTDNMEEEGGFVAEIKGENILEREGVYVTPDQVTTPYRLRVIYAMHCHSLSKFTVGEFAQGGFITARWLDHADVVYGYKGKGYSGTPLTRIERCPKCKLK